MAGINCIVTDDFKIMVNRMFLAYKDDNKEDFKTSGKYILKEIKQREYDSFLYDSFLEYLYGKIKNEVV